jgi:hypothetical protein
MAVSYLLAGKNHDALGSHFDEARPLIAEASFVSIVVEGQRAIALARLGYGDAAAEALRIADERRRSRPVDAFVHTLVDLADGTVRRHAGDLDAARRILAAVGDDALRQNDLELASSAWQELVSVCEELGDHVGALAAFRHHHEAYGKMHADAMGAAAVSVASGSRRHSGTPTSFPSTYRVARERSTPLRRPRHALDDSVETAPALVNGVPQTAATSSA